MHKVPFLRAIASYRLAFEEPSHSFYQGDEGMLVNLSIVMGDIMKMLRQKEISYHTLLYCIISLHILSIYIPIRRPPPFELTLQKKY